MYFILLMMKKIKPFMLLNRGGLTFQIAGSFLLLQEGILLKSTLVLGPGLWLGIIASVVEERERERETSSLYSHLNGLLQQFSPLGLPTLFASASLHRSIYICIYING